MTSARMNRIKVTRNATTRNVTLHMERRDAWGNLEGRSQFTLKERDLERALLDANIIAPWNRA